METQSLKWYHNKSGVIILLLLLPPLGLYLMWKHSEYWSRSVKIIITILVIGLGSQVFTNTTDNTYSSSNKCLLDGCEKEGQGWFHDSQSKEMRDANLYGVYRVAESGGYCSREHGYRDN